MIKLICGDVYAELKNLDAGSVQCIVTSPPYWRCVNYEHPDQIGLEETYSSYKANILEAMFQCKRVLRSDGVLWLNIGDVYNKTGGAGGDYSCTGRKFGRAKYGGRCDPVLPAKTLFGLPWDIAIELTELGWTWRNTIVWVRSKCCAARDRNIPNWEPMLMFVKSSKYKYHKQAGEVGRNVWNIPNNNKTNHPAPFPVELARRCIVLSCDFGDTVLDPFCGSGSVGVAAKICGCDFIGIDIKQEYIDMATEACSRGQK